MADDKFLDEGAKKTKKKPQAGDKGKPKAPKTEPVVIEEDDAPEQTISLFLAVGMIVGALIIGLVVGYAVAPKGTAGDAVDQTGVSAPALTPEQLEGNQLPAGHPTVPGAESTGTTGNASESTPTDEGKTKSEKE